MAETKFNIPIATWEMAVAQLYGILEEIARQGPRTTITYGQVVDQLTVVRLEPDSHAFHHMLGEVSERSFHAGGPLLSAVVVHKDDDRPGGGFCMQNAMMLLIPRRMVRQVEGR